MPQPLSRRRFLQMMAAGSALATGVGGSYTFAIAPNELVVERVEVAAPLPTGLQIGVISDLHLVDQASRERVEHAVSRLAAEQPDLVVILGDYSTSIAGEVRDQIRADVQTSMDILAGLDAPLGRYAILGNHDIHADLPDIQQMLQSRRLHPLSNTHTALAIRGESFAVVGLADAIRARPSFREARQGLPADIPILGLVHEPDAAPRFRSAALVLSGHSHGGQVRLPVLGAPVLPRLGKRFPWGLRRSESTLVYTTRGVGMMPPRLRINCPPEVTVITIVSEGGRQPMPALAAR